MNIRNYPFLAVLFLIFIQFSFCLSVFAQDFSTSIIINNNVDDNLTTNFDKTKYWVFFSEKDTTNYDYLSAISEKTIKNRTLQNLPLWQYSNISVSEKFVAKVESLLIKSSTNKVSKTVVKSKWLNAISIYLDDEEAKRV